MSEQIHAPSFQLGGGFRLGPVDANLASQPHPPTPQQVLSESLQQFDPKARAVLSQFKGRFFGYGFNTIFRPSGDDNRADPDEELKTPIKRDSVKASIAASGRGDDNLLEINLTRETLVFSESLGTVPNRGLQRFKDNKKTFRQRDVALRGVSYVHTVQDVTNTTTGRANGTARDIHFEPGLWMYVPRTDFPKSEATICRMGCVPHGVTFNASTEVPTIQELPGPPEFNSFAAKTAPGSHASLKEAKEKFPSLNVSNSGTVRLPQDLGTFIETRTITQEILDDPTIFLKNANKGKNILKTLVLAVNTSPPPTRPANGAVVPGNDIISIGFLEGSRTQKLNSDGNGFMDVEITDPNAKVFSVASTFYIQTVQHQIELKSWKPGQSESLVVKPLDLPPGANLPVFLIKPKKEIKQSRIISVKCTHIQYQQDVQLQFASGTFWPHVSVATLVPLDPVEVDPVLLE